MSDTTERMFCVSDGAQTVLIYLIVNEEYTACKYGEIEGGEYSTESIAESATQRTLARIHEIPYEIHIQMAHQSPVRLH